MSAAQRAGPRPLIVGNWKLHGDTKSNATLLGRLKQSLAQLSGVEIVVCPPVVYLAQVREILRDSTIALGAQDLSDQRQGAYTGECSAPMLKDAGCEYAIVGHSERRRWYDEDDERVGRKFAAALAAGIKPILCVGENEAERDAGNAEQVVARQLAAAHSALVSAPDISIDAAAAGRQWLVAYEPIWAIGTGRAASSGQIVEMHGLIRRHLKAAFGTACAARVVYGGSVKPDNASALLTIAEVDGGLIGGASLDGESFYRICAAAGDRRDA